MITLVDISSPKHAGAALDAAYFARHFTVVHKQPIVIRSVYDAHTGTPHLAVEWDYVAGEDEAE